jgi:glycerol-3-phosphate dehydrogenase
MLASLRASESWDVCVIGGGASGLGTALQAAASGLRTLLVEKHDFAKGTSSRSTKLIHGGVRYLQQGNLRLVIDALQERGQLVRKSPDLVWELPLIIPTYSRREHLYYKTGLWLYDWLAGKLALTRSKGLYKEELAALQPGLAQENVYAGVQYTDGQFDDTSLALAIAQTAASQGATLLNHFHVEGLLKHEGQVTGLIARDTLTGELHEIKAKAVVNATGAFVDQILRHDRADHANLISPSQGIHLVVDKSFLPGAAGILIPKTDDGRVLFAVPWRGKTLLGTTDTAVEHVSEEPIAQEAEIDFVLGHMGRYLNKAPQRSDVLSMFAGLRPLIKQKSTATASLSRDHAVQISASGLVTVLGGKWTTYRKMAQDVVRRVNRKFGFGKKIADTKKIPLEAFSNSHFHFELEGVSDMALRAHLRFAVEETMAYTVEDMLSRRTRHLLLDARQAIHHAPRIAALLAEIHAQDDAWADAQTAAFTQLANGYIPSQSCPPS